MVMFSIAQCFFTVRIIKGNSLCDVYCISNVFTLWADNGSRIQFSGFVFWQSPKSQDLIDSFSLEKNWDQLIKQLIDHYVAPPQALSTGVDLRTLALVSKGDGWSRPRLCHISRDPERGLGMSVLPVDGTTSPLLHVRTSPAVTAASDLSIKPDNFTCVS